MPSIRAVLEARQRAAAVRLEELGAELERVRQAVAEAEEELWRRVIGLEQFLEAPAETGAPAPADDGQASGTSLRPTGPRKAVPHRKGVPGAQVLAADYQAVMAAAREAGDEGLGARQAAVALGWDSVVASRVEGARARLKRLVERGWLVEEKPGRFTLPPGPATPVGRRGGGS